MCSLRPQLHAIEGPRGPMHAMPSLTCPVCGLVLPERCEGDPHIVEVFFLHHKYRMHRFCFRGGYRLAWEIWASDRGIA